MDDKTLNTKRRSAGTAQLLEQVARRVLERRSSHDLHAAQWSALRYFARSGRRTANVIGLSRYLGNTSGSTSRTARTLVEKNLLSVTPAKHDARSLTFKLTELGHKTLENDPLHEIAAILEPMSREYLAQLSGCLEHISSSIEEKRSEE